VNGLDFSFGSIGEYTVVASANRAVRGVLSVVESSEFDRCGACMDIVGVAFTSVGISYNAV